MHKPFSYLLLITAVISCFLPAYGQTISSEIFENEEDLKDALEREAISYNEYLEILELMSSKVELNSDEKYKLLVIPGISWGDLNQKEDRLYPLEQRTSGFAKESKDKINTGITWQAYQNLKGEEDLSNRFSLKFSQKNYFDFKGEFSQQGKRNLEVRKRSAELLFSQNSFNLIVGNYDKRFGLGINIGYYSFLNYIRDDTLYARDQFLYPLRARYNGIFTEYRFNPFKTSVFYSANRWSYFKDWIWGGDFSWSFRKMDLGVTFSQAQMRRLGHSASYEDECLSLHLQTDFKTTNLLAEYAKMLEAGEGLGLVLLSQSQNYSLDWSFWNYSSNFIHLHNGGPSQADYESINIEKIDYSYKSRQAGEKGVNFVSKYKILPALKLSLGYTQWSEAKDLPKKVRAKVGIGYFFSKKYSFVLEKYWMDNSLEQEQLDGEKTNFSFEASPFSKFKFRIMTSYGEKMLKAGKRKYGDLQFKVNSSFFSFCDLTFWLKCYDPNLNNSRDNIYRFYLEEKVRFLKTSSFIFGLALKYNRLTNSIEDKAVRTRLSINW
jgi:hypothetical protein